MKRLWLTMLGLMVLAPCTIGCSDKTSSSTEKEVSTPEGTTTETTTKEVEKSGDNPPATTEEAK